MTGRREELRDRKEGIEKREGGILCNGVENTKERQTHAFVIFVPPPPLLFPVSDFCSLPSVSPSGSTNFTSTNIPLIAVLFLFYTCVDATDDHYEF